jgi:glycosyltransferase involved in cell wall biosynthesis
MKILWVKAGPLVPLNAGGRIRSWNILKNLGQWDEVTLLTYSPSYVGTHQEGVPEHVAKLISLEFPGPAKYSAGYYLEYLRLLFSAAPFTVRKTGITSIRLQIEELLRKEHFDIVVADFLSATLTLPKKTPCPMILFAHNVETEIWKRHFEVTRSPIRKMVMGIEYLKMRRFEKNPPRHFDHILTVSEKDREFFSQILPADEVSVLPTGVDLNFFCPSSTPPVPGRLVFSGSMDWMANEDAILYFAEAILPIVAKSVPGVSLTAAGRDPTEPLRKLSKEDPRIQLTGTVPDIRPHVAAGEVYVVPLRVGSGTRLKIFEAMAMGKAVVSTRVGAEGLPVVHGEHVLLADEPEEFANAVVRLLGDKELRGRLGKASHLLVTEKFGNPAVAKVCHDILARVVEAAHSRNGHRT